MTKVIALGNRLNEMVTRILVSLNILIAVITVYIAIPVAEETVVAIRRAKQRNGANTAFKQERVPNREPASIHIDDELPIEDEASYKLYKHMPPKPVKRIPFDATGYTTYRVH